MKSHNTFSSGFPSFSKIPSAKNGSISPTIKSAAGSFPMLPRDARYAGIPASPPSPKHMICLFVRLNATFVFTFDKSFGTGTNGIYNTSLPGSLAFASARERL